MKSSLGEEQKADRGFGECSAATALSNVATGEREGAKMGPGGSGKARQTKVGRRQTVCEADSLVNYFPPSQSEINRCLRE